MKKILRTVLSILFLSCLLCQAHATEEDDRYLDETVDDFASSLIKQIARRDFDLEKRPVIKIAVFDFIDQGGNISVGSRYISDLFRLAFGRNPQFHLVPLQKLGNNPHINAISFSKNGRLKERLINELKSDAYLFGQIQTSDRSQFVCQVSLWGIREPSEGFAGVEPIPLKEPELLWRPSLTNSGFDFFTQVVMGPEQIKDGPQAQGINLADVMFLTQPMCDDLNQAWQVKADGMIYDKRQEKDEGSLHNRAGQVMQSRVKSPEALKELSYVIKNFGLVVRENSGDAFELESYVIPRESNYYFIPYRREKEELGLRFMYLWNIRGRSSRPSTWETGKGWKFYMAEADWSLKLPVGIHTATATLEPVAESEYGTKRPKAEYVRKFKFSVSPGLNVYAINYVYRRDRPEIFIRRLDFSKPEDERGRGILRIREIYKVYGLD
jgi:hypothetical protein